MSDQRHEARVTLPEIAQSVLSISCPSTAAWRLSLYTGLNGVGGTMWPTREFLAGPRGVGRPCAASRQEFTRT